MLVKGKIIFVSNKSMNLKLLMNIADMTNLWPAFCNNLRLYFFFFVKVYLVSRITVPENASQIFHFF